LTVTTSVAVAVLPFSSVAEHVTFVRPRLKRLPERGVHVTGTARRAVSLAVTMKRTRTRLAFRACTVLS
jgi:hypothetical protein